MAILYFMFQSNTGCTDAEINGNVLMNMYERLCSLTSLSGLSLSITSMHILRQVLEVGG